MLASPGVREEAQGGGGGGQELQRRFGHKLGGNACGQEGTVEHPQGRREAERRGV